MKFIGVCIHILSDFYLLKINKNYNRELELGMSGDGRFRCVSVPMRVCAVSVKSHKMPSYECKQVAFTFICLIRDFFLSIQLFGSVVIPAFFDYPLELEETYKLEACTMHTYIYIKHILI